MRLSGVVSCAVAVGVMAGSVATVHGQTDPKAARTCRKEIAKDVSKVIATGLKVVSDCHANRDKGKFSGECNDLLTADVKGKYAKALVSATKGIDKKCPLGNVVRGNYAGGDIDGALYPEIETAIESLATTVLGAPTLQGDKARIKCHGELGKAVSKVVAEIIKGSIKCQTGLDKAASVFGELAGACLVAPLKSGPKGNETLAKKCASLVPADVGTCDPLVVTPPTQSCAVATSGTAGQTLAVALFGEPIPGCGNSVPDPGEDCDDGNTIETDGCIACHFATCGDGFVHAGVELCGDAPADACATPTPDTCAANLQPCGDSGARQSVRVRFGKPGGKNITGLKIALDYPESKVGVPGFADDQSVQDRVTNVATPFFSINDRDYVIEVAGNQIDPIPAGDFFTVQLDNCIGAGAPVALSEFGCKVLEASDDLNQLVTNQVTCTVVAP